MSQIYLSSQESGTAIIVKMNKSKIIKAEAGLIKDLLDAVISILSNDLPNSKQLYEEVLIGLYQRLSICVKHHPVDFPEYLKAWNYWTEIVRSQ